MEMFFKEPRGQPWGLRSCSALRLLFHSPSSFTANASIRTNPCRHPLTERLIIIIISVFYYNRYNRLVAFRLHVSSSNQYSPEARDRAVRMVLEHQCEVESRWAGIGSITAKIGSTNETLCKRVRRAEADKGVRAGLTSVERERLRAPERENRGTP